MTATMQTVECLSLVNFVEKVTAARGTDTEPIMLMVNNPDNYHDASEYFFERDFDTVEDLYRYICTYSLYDRGYLTANWEFDIGNTTFRV